MNTKNNKNSNVAALLLGAFRKIISLQALGFIIALIAIGYTFYDHYKLCPDILVSPRILYTCNYFDETADFCHDGAPYNYRPEILASFRFINRSSVPVTIIGYTATLCIRDIPGQRKCLPWGVTAPIEFTIPPHESIIRCFNSYISPPLTYEEARHYEQILREGTERNGDGIEDLFPQISYEFASDRGDIFRAKPYDTDPSVLPWLTGSSSSGYLSAEFRYREMNSDIYPEAIVDDPTIITRYLPDAPRFPVLKDYTNSDKTVSQHYTYQTWPPINPVSGRRLRLQSEKLAEPTSIMTVNTNGQSGIVIESYGTPSIKRAK